ncbi:MAG TPA: hypothetical protein VI451_14030 [Anaerolineales bacterium]|nr:hypothetical protein [Anaerolineales bacterium]
MSNAPPAAGPPAPSPDRPLSPSPQHPGTRTVCPDAAGPARRPLQPMPDLWPPHAVAWPAAQRRAVVLRRRG